ncbi:hypothetical protein [Gandjariella thermophila]|uniref:O-antigen polymerase n=1 Tax=Gandjariella thermophila TaxID=1931992 RepID=A0A4D4J9S7_9PSEU|nr:hypothetical protein [Gandjariella thermophila]GDY32042.1 hypothetical protein GTS_36750 [Gandjariella thermophila]
MTSGLRAAAPASAPRTRDARWPAAAAVVVAVLAGVAAPATGPLLTAGLAVVALVAAAAYRPIFATYLYLATLPLVAGIDRGKFIPLVRPNEALLALLLAGAGLGGFLRWVQGRPLPLRARRVDLPLAMFVVLATVWPLASMMLRGHHPHGDDLAAVLPVCKLTALYLLVRCTVRTEPQTVRCIRLVVWPAAAIAVLAVLQTLHVGPVVSALATLWPSDSGVLGERGTTTLGSSIATGDYITISLTMVICCAGNGLLGRRERLVLGLTLGAGVLAAGQFSTWVAAAVAAVVLLRRFPGLRGRLVRMLPIAAVAVLVGAPAFLGRLDGFGDGYGVPRSWLGRWDNLSTFYLPRLGDFGFVTGVSPNSVLPAPETWRNEIFLESGYLQFLWVGGIPLLVAFGWLSFAVLRATGRVRADSGAVGACAITLQVGWWIVLVLSLIDIHLVLRGAGDLLFTLLAITTGGTNDDRDP